MRGTIWVFGAANLFAQVVRAESLPTARFGDVQATERISVQMPATETALSSPELPDSSAAPSLAERTEFAERVARIGELMLKLEQREGAVFEKLAERYTKLAQFTAELERRDEEAFSERAARFVRLVDFARQLRLDQEKRESEEFEAHLGHALKVQAFMKRLSTARAALRIEVPNTLAPEPQEWIH